MESKIMVTIPCQFSSRWSSNKYHVSLLAKSNVWVLPPGGLSESPKFTKISCKLGHGLYRKKKKTRCGIACVPGDGEDATRSVLVVSFRSDIDGSACARRPPHIPYYTHAYTFNSERELSCLVRCCRPRGRWSGSEESRERVALFGKTCRSGTAGCSRPAALTFRQCSKVAEARTAQICSRAFMIRVLELDLSLDLISKTPLRRYIFLLPRKHQMYVLPYSWAKKTQGQQRRQAARLNESAKQLFDLDSDRVTWTVLVPRQTEVSISVWGKPRNWGIPFSRPISARLFILAPGPFLATQYDGSQVGPGSRLVVAWRSDTCVWLLVLMPHNKHRHRHVFVTGTQAQSTRCASTFVWENPARAVQHCICSHINQRWRQPLTAMAIVMVSLSQFSHWSH